MCLIKECICWWKESWYSILCFNFTFVWPWIVTNFCVTKPTRCANFTNLFCHETLHVSDSSSVHHQEFIHCTLSNGICHTGLQTAVCKLLKRHFFYVHVTVHRNKTFFVIKPTRCTNFTIFLSWKSACFIQFVCPSSGVYSLYNQQWYMSYRFVDSSPAGPGWNCSSILVLLESCLQCTVNKLLMMDRGTVRIMKTFTPE